MPHLNLTIKDDLQVILLVLSFVGHPIYTLYMHTDVLISFQTKEELKLN